MPANASGPVPTADSADVGKTVAQLPLSVDVQFAAALSAAAQVSDVPSAAEFEQWAQHTFLSASGRGWASAWRERTGAIEETELCIRLVDAVEGEALNATWRDKQSPTNVLSFEADIVAGHYAPLGDLVLCAPVVASEAAAQGKSVSHHYAHLVTHGVLHLLGFDHQIDTEAEAMEAMEATVLGELGIGNPYD